MEVTGEIREYFIKRMGALGRVIDTEDPTFLLEAELGQTTRHHHSGDIFRAEVNITLAGKHYRAVAETTDIHASIDEVQEEIIAELKKSKGKERSLLKRGGQKIKDIIHGWYSKD